MKVYISGPYEAGTEAKKQFNIARAADFAAILLRLGFVPFCPHTMSADFELRYPDIPRQRYIEVDLEWIQCCDVVLMLPGWKASQGALAEKFFAMQHAIPVFCTIRELVDWKEEQVHGCKEEVEE